MGGNRNKMPAPKPAGDKSVEPTENSAPKLIKVVTIRKGFFGNVRYFPGDEFVVRSMDKLGSWMQCCDPEIEKKHQAIIKEKKAGK